MTTDIVGNDEQSLPMIRGRADADPDFPPAGLLDCYSLDNLIELKVTRFISQLGDYQPDDLHTLLMGKFEKLLLTHALRSCGGNQTHTAKLLGINRNTLRKKLNLYEI